MTKKIMGIGVPHVPFITGSPELGDPKQVNGLIDMFNQKREAIEQFDPDLVIIISGEHVNKFFMENVPPFCVGVAPQYDGPSDKGARLPYVEFPGDERFAEQMIRSGYDAGYDLAFASQWSMDHGYMVPLHLLTGYKYPIVPIFVNTAIPPLPTVKRCYQLGTFIRQVIEQDTTVEKVLVIGAGGLSHSVGREDMGMVDENFDHRFLRYLADGDVDGLLSITYEEMDKAGSSTHEVLAWVVAAGVFLPEKSHTDFYEPIQGFATGCGISSWYSELSVSSKRWMG
jgi:hypothetical protein